MPSKRVTSKTLNPSIDGHKRSPADVADLCQQVFSQDDMLGLAVVNDGLAGSWALHVPKDFSLVIGDNGMAKVRVTDDTQRTIADFETLANLRRHLADNLEAIDDLLRFWRSLPDTGLPKGAVLSPPKIVPPGGGRYDGKIIRPSPGTPTGRKP